MRPDRRDLRPVRVRGLRESRDRGRPHQLPDAQHPARSPGAGPVGHALRRRRGPPPADAHLARARSASCATTPPPIRALLPGRCFRYEAIDASHASEFFQVEGLMVDEGTTMGDLQGPPRPVRQGDVRGGQEDPLPAGLLPVHRAVRGVRRRVPRLRRRPAARPAGRTGWMTILGAGMVHPVVLQYGGLDPERYQGFAFGMGPERIKMLKHGIARPAPVPGERPALPGAVPMRVPLSWLREFVDVDLAPEALAERLTMLGMEVKGIVAWGADWRNVVVGRAAVRRAAPARRPAVADPGARSARASRSSIVCGATNIAAGQRVPVALPGAVLPGDRRIERTEKMGVVSNGMLCSGDELGLTADADGILILPADTPLGRRADRAVRRHRPRRRRQAEPRRRAVDRRAGARGRGGHRRAAPPPADRRGRVRPPTAERLARRRRRPRPLPAVRRALGQRRHGSARRRTGSRCACWRPASGRSATSSTPRNYVMVELGKPIHTFDAAAVHDGRIIVRRAAAGRAPRDPRPRRPRARPRDPRHRRRRRADRRSPGSWAAPTPRSATRRPTSSSNRRSSTRSASAGRPSATPSAPRRACASRRARNRASRGSAPTGRPASSPSGPAATVAPGAVDTEPGRAGTPPTSPSGRSRVNRLLGTALDADEQRALLARVGIETAPAAPGTRDPGRRRHQAARRRARRRRGHRRDRADLAARPRRRGGHRRGDHPRPRLRPRPGGPPAHADAALPPRPAGGPRRRPRDPRRGRADARSSPSRSSRRGWSSASRRTTTVRPDGEPEQRSAGRPIVVTNPLSSQHSVLRQSLHRQPRSRSSRRTCARVATTSRSSRSARATARHGRAADPRVVAAGLRADRRGASRPRWNRPARPYDLDDAKGVIELVCRRLGFAAAGIHAADRRPEPASRAGPPRSRPAATSSAGSASCIPRSSTRSTCGPSASIVAELAHRGAGRRATRRLPRVTAPSRHPVGRAGPRRRRRRARPGRRASRRRSGAMAGRCCAT